MTVHPPLGCVLQFLMFLTAPVSYPIAWVLDRVLGHRHTALFRWVERSGLLGGSISAAFVERNQSGLPTHGWCWTGASGHRLGHQRMLALSFA